jgi:hypothetical protein
MDETDGLIAQSRAVREYGMTVSDELAQRIDKLHATVEQYRATMATLRRTVETAFQPRLFPTPR